MLFHSIAFFYFFVTIYTVSFLLNFLARKFPTYVFIFKINKLFLLGASYYFYAFWDVRFLALIIISTLVDFCTGSWIYKVEGKKNKKSILLLSLVVNLGMLAFFKYCNFFIESANLALSNLNLTISHINVILPVGISFFTFQSMSYSLDIYFKKLKPVRDPIDFALYVAFFPQLVAGPIVRASQFLPQILRQTKLSAKSFFIGLQIFLYGLFLKVVIADNIAKIIDPIFKNPEFYDSLAVWVAVIGYSVQIFCDFCGYSEMAIGTAFSLGYILPVNFRTPYLATDLFDFWRRWHISLTSWLRDYLYIPLGGNQKGLIRTCINISITMLLGGLWHGANLTFALWGLFHGIGLMINRIIVFFLKGRITPNVFLILCRWASTYLFVCLGWVLFRSESLDTAVQIYKKLFIIEISSLNWSFLSLENLFFIPCMIIIHLWFYITKQDSLTFKPGTFASHIYIALMVLLVFVFAPMDHKGFIYFQF
jgi:alginate O-acetyltransferase complex protein AlgI